MKIKKYTQGNLTVLSKESRVYRARHNLNQRELGNRVGLTPRQVSLIECGYYHKISEKKVVMMRAKLMDLIRADLTGKRGDL